MIYGNFPNVAYRLVPRNKSSVFANKSILHSGGVSRGRVRCYGCGCDCICNCGCGCDHCCVWLCLGLLMCVFFIVPPHNHESVVEGEPSANKSCRLLARGETPVLMDALPSFNQNIAPC